LKEKVSGGNSSCSEDAKKENKLCNKKKREKYNKTIERII
jgi:hypothetical protein